MLTFVRSFKLFESNNGLLIKNGIQLNRVIKRVCDSSDIFEQVIKRVWNSLVDIFEQVIKRVCTSDVIGKWYHHNRSEECKYYLFITYSNGLAYNKKASIGNVFGGLKIVYVHAFFVDMFSNAFLLFLIWRKITSS